jgi:hypothetical protein
VYRGVIAGGLPFADRGKESGVALPSSTILDRKFAIRVAITNHRSRREDFDALLTAALEFGRAIVSDPLATEAASR